MISTVFLFGLNIISRMGKCFRWSSYLAKYDFDEGKITLTVFLFILNMILTKGKWLRQSCYLA